MSDDILWRLEGEGSPRALYGAPPLLIEAANEIRSLRAREARLREALEKIIHEDLWTTKHPDGVTQRGESVFDGYFGGIARAALEGKDEK
jgi:hypothetical protein